MLYSFRPEMIQVYKALMRNTTKKENISVINVTFKAYNKHAHRLTNTVSLILSAQLVIRVT